MQVELDHIFICTSTGAPEANRLIEFGLSEGPPNHYPGQRTANRRFFFCNAFLELLWVVNPAETKSLPIQRTRLWERWSGRSRDSSPFGICLRPVDHDADEVPFPAWQYRPPYLPDPLVIYMATNSEMASGPLLFYITFGGRTASVRPSGRQPLEHLRGIQSITRVKMSMPDRCSISPELRAIQMGCRWLSFERADDDLVELGFDGESEGQSVDFRPALPLIIGW